MRGHFDPGFKFLPVPYNSKLEDYYLPSKLESTDYPNLIKPGEPYNGEVVTQTAKRFTEQFGLNGPGR